MFILVIWHFVNTPSDRNSGRLSVKTDQKKKSPTRKFSEFVKITDQYLNDLNLSCCSVIHGLSTLLQAPVYSLFLSTIKQKLPFVFVTIDILYFQFRKSNIGCNIDVKIRAVFYGIFNIAL